MLISEILSNTNRAAGCLIRAKDSERWLFLRRSAYVDDPLLWALPGGHIEEGEKFLQGAIREAQEEAGIDLSEAPHRLIYATDGTWPRSVFRIYAFQIPEEVEPVLNWESEDHKWCALDSIPDPRHPGLDALFSHDRSAELLKEWLESLS